MIELSERAQRVLSQTQLNARDDITLIAKRLKMKVHSVRYELAQLIEQGLLYPYMLTNHFALGLQEVDFFCTLGDRRKGDIDKLVKALQNTPGLFVLNLTGGDYQLEFSIVVSNLANAQKFFEELCSTYDLRIAAKATGISLSWTLFHRKYMSRAAPRVASIETKPTGEVVSLDSGDREILNVLGITPLMSMRDLAQKVGMPESTAKFRVRRLETAGVILGYGLSLDGAAIGMSSYDIILTLRDHSAAVKKRLYEFCQKHPHILSYGEWLGTWDLIVRCEVFKPRDGFDIADQVALILGPALGQLELVPLLHEVNVQRTRKFGLV